MSSSSRSIRLKYNLSPPLPHSGAQQGLAPYGSIQFNVSLLNLDQRCVSGPAICLPVLHVGKHLVTDQPSQLTLRVGIGIGIVIDFGNTIKSIYIADSFPVIVHFPHVFLSSFPRRIIICYNLTTYATTIQHHHHAILSNCILVRYFTVRHKQLVNQVLPLSSFCLSTIHY